MNRRKLIGGIALLALMGFAFGFGPEGRIVQNQWGTGVKLVFAVAICSALFAAFYDRKNLPKKAFDFNPKRGLMYFLLGWILLPVLLVFRWGMKDMDYSVADLAVGTLVMSVLIGIIGTFTENTGI